ncbi:MAG TPA: kelch repeat-containing protein, partial [Candidatus Acidoferrales bacterium]|nr:kelch repeat-containing protein [Candidatus Acidoferrales bacterium]
MAQPRGFYSATLLENGRILVAGGFVQAPDRELFGAELYDPRSNTWEPTGNLVTGRAGHAAVLLDDGKVLVAGGQAFDPQARAFFLDSAEVYDPAIGRWTITGSMAVPRTEPILTSLEDGKVFTSGAIRARGPFAVSAEIYDPATGQWTRIADMGTPRNDHAQILLDDGRVLVAGGFAGPMPGDVYHTSAEIYDPNSDTWAPTGSMTMARADAEGVVLRDGRVLVTGGNTVLRPPTRTDTAEIYDLDTGTWTRTSGVMSDPKVDHASTMLKDGRVFVVGGIRSRDHPVASSDIYDPESDRWTPTASMLKARGGFSAVALKHGRG